jgi:hypothetical protein
MAPASELSHRSAETLTAATAREFGSDSMVYADPQ